MLRDCVHRIMLNNEENVAYFPCNPEVLKLVLQSMRIVKSDSVNDKSMNNSRFAIILGFCSLNNGVKYFIQIYSQDNKMYANRTHNISTFTIGQVTSSTCCQCQI